MKEDSTETSVVIADSNFVIDTVLNDKLDYIGIKLLSRSRNKLLQKQKDNNEEQR